jgi:hypothetical protein
VVRSNFKEGVLVSCKENYPFLTSEYSIVLEGNEMVLMRLTYLSVFKTRTVTLAV